MNKYTLFAKVLFTTMIMSYLFSSCAPINSAKYSDWNKQNYTILEYSEEGARPCDGDCQNGFGTIFYLGTKDKVYSGNWKDGDFHGQGTTFHPNGAIRYTGNWKEGKKNGTGSFSNDQGFKRYEGDWKNNIEHGEGMAYYPNGDRFEGAFQEGKKHGKGTLFFSNEDEFTANWHNGVIIGEGQLKVANNSMSHRQGAADLIPSRCLVSGDCKTGFGIIQYDNGSRYEGNFKEGKFDGQGKFYNMDGVLIYEGTYANHQREGKGISYFSSGTKQFEGTWVNNEPSKSGKYYSFTGELLVIAKE